MNARRRLTAAVLVSTSATAVALTANVAQADPGRHDRAATTDLVSTVRKAIQPYQDVAAAEAAGYVSTGECTASPAGAMGVHYINYAILTSPGPFDPERPPILMYGPTEDGGQRLLGAEWMQPDFGQPRPDLLGEPFDGPMAGHSPGMPTHYDLHVWSQFANPAGVFAPWNPRVVC